MNVLQPKLSIGNEGRVLIDSTNVKPISGKKSSKKSKKANENDLPSKVKRIDGIYTDPPNSAKKQKKFTNVSTQTESSETTDVKSCGHTQSIIDMLTNDEATPGYWKAIAEKRRAALYEALDENRTLKEEYESVKGDNQVLEEIIEEVNEKNAFLKGENKILEEMLEEAKQLATFVQGIIDADEAPKVLSDKEESPESEKTSGEDASLNDGVHRDSTSPVNECEGRSSEDECRK